MVVKATTHSSLSCKRETYMRCQGRWWTHRLWICPVSRRQYLRRGSRQCAWRAVLRQVEFLADIDFPFYVVLGNHDAGCWGAGCELYKTEQKRTTHTTQTRTMFDQYYRFDTEHVTFFGLDTNAIMWDPWLSSGDDQDVWFDLKSPQQTNGKLLLDIILTFPTVSTECWSLWRFGLGRLGNCGCSIGTAVKNLWTHESAVRSTYIFRDMTTIVSGLSPPVVQSLSHFCSRKNNGSPRQRQPYQIWRWSHGRVCGSKFETTALLVSSVMKKVTEFLISSASKCP